MSKKYHYCQKPFERRVKLYTLNLPQNTSEFNYPEGKHEQETKTTLHYTPPIFIFFKMCLYDLLILSAIGLITIIAVENIWDAATAKKVDSIKEDFQIILHKNLETISIEPKNVITEEYSENEVIPITPPKSMESRIEGKQNDLVDSEESELKTNDANSIDDQIVNN